MTSEKLHSEEGEHGRAERQDAYKLLAEREGEEGHDAKKQEEQDRAPLRDLLWHFHFTLSYRGWFGCPNWQLYLLKPGSAAGDT